MTTVLDERFEIRRRLGAGGMGEVFEALDRDRGEVVALKSLRHPNPAALYNFKKEFRFLQDVSHPNLVSLYELVVDGGHWFFTMELVDGEGLKDYVYPMDQTLPIVVGEEPRAEPALSVERLRAALGQLASGVQAVHDAGRLHRDLKPSNVMVTRSGRVVILDFGVATELAPAMNLRSVDTGIAGTAAYMAPEQARGEPAQPASDWYGVGVMLFEIMTGRWPFTGSLARILIDKQFQRAISPAELVPDLPGDLVELCSALLETEPQDRPLGAEILERLGGGDAGVATKAGGRREASVLVGRRAHLDALEDAFALAQDGHGVAVHVHGPSGIGKTTLVHHFLHRVMERTQARVLAGRCYEHEMVPYKALDGIVDSLSRYLKSLDKRLVGELLPRRIDALARLFPVLMRVEAVAAGVEALSETGRQTLELDNPDRPHLRRQALGALRRLLERLVTLQPLALHVDDLQWADADSVKMLRGVMAAPGAPPVLLVTSFRTDDLEAKPFLRELLAGAGDPAAGEPTCRGLAVGALSAGEAREYVERSLGPRRRTPFVVETIVREAAGSPFFLEQLTRHAAGSRSGVSAGLSLVEMMEERLRQLPRGGVALLNVLAAAGRPVAAAVAAEAAGAAGDERRLLAALKTACLVRGGTSEQGVELYHDRIREALLSRLRRVEARRVHGRLLAALEARGGDDPEMLLELANRAGDVDKAARWARRAAEKAAAALAYERAAELYRRAIELAADDPAGKLALRDRLANTLARGGRTRQAADLHLELAAVHTGLKALEYRRAAAMEYLMSGYVDRGLEVSKEVLEAVGLGSPATPWRTLAIIFLNRWRLRWRGLEFTSRDVSEVAPEELLRVETAWAMASGLAVADPLRAAAFQSRHLLLALDAGEPHRVARALALEIGLRAVSDRRARLRIDELYERAVELGDGYAAALAELQRGVAFFLRGEWSRAREICDQAEGLFLDSSGVAVWEVFTARRFALTSLALMGELEQVAQRLPMQLAEALERGNVYGRNDLRTRLILHWLAGDDPEQAEREIAEASASGLDRGFHVLHWSVLTARAQVRLYRGQGREALAGLEAEWPRLEASLLLRIRATRVESAHLQARALLAAALEEEGPRRRRRLRRAEGVARRLRRETLALARPYADLVSAGADALAGRGDAARRALADAVSGFESWGMQLYAQAARRRLAELAGEDGERDRVDAAMAHLGVESPERMTRMLAPGF